MHNLQQQKFRKISNTPSKVTYLHVLTMKMIGLHNFTMMNVGIFEEHDYPS